MLKTYKSLENSLGILVELGGEMRHVDFDWDIVSPAGHRGCSFSTDDQAMQEALEHHEYFGRRLRPNFWTDSEESKDEESRKPKEKRGKKN